MPNPRPGRRARPTLERFLFDTWLPAIASTVRPSTLLGYGCHVRRHIAPRLGALRLHELDAPGLNRFYAELIAGEHGRSLTPTTVRRVHATLRRALRDAVRWGMLDDNPARHSDPPRAAPREGELRTWDVGQLRCFLASVRGDDHYVLWAVLAMTGMRRGEALGLRWGDVDLERGRVAIRRTIVAVGGEVQWSSPKTARGRRVIALDQPTLRLLRTLARRRRRRPRPEELIFAGPDGAPLDPGSISKRFAALVRESGLPRIRLHDLRHTHATLALSAGIHPKIVSERLGHATVAITLDVYSHALGHLQAEAAEAVGALVWKR